MSESILKTEQRYVLHTRDTKEQTGPSGLKAKRWTCLPIQIATRCKWAKIFQIKFTSVKHTITLQSRSYRPRVDERLFGLKKYKDRVYQKAIKKIQYSSPR